MQSRNQSQSKMLELKPNAKAPSRTTDYSQMKIKIPNPSQEPPASSKAPNQDLKDMGILCTFEIKMES